MAKEQKELFFFVKVMEHLIQRSTNILYITVALQDKIPLPYGEGSG